MNKIILTVLFSFLCLYTHAQTLSGRVYGAGKDSILVGASVFYSGSTTGTTTDKDGRFTLQAKQKQIPVIVSFIGYNSATVNYEPGKPLIVHLKPKEEALHEVTIRVNGMDRRDEIAIFIREFIGNSTYANSCTIKNMDDIDLFYSKKTGVLTASCDKPIIIENPKLGYTITYYLDNFQRTYKSVRYGGNYIFKDNLPASTKQQAKIFNNREDAYIGSRMHFIRALWHEKVDKEGFRIYTPTLQALSEINIMKHDSLMQKYVVLENKIYIYHKSDMHHSSSLIPVTKVSYIDKDGYYSTGIEWGGLIGYQRVGDLLPFEYQPSVDLIANVSKVKKDTLAATSNKRPDDKNTKLFKSIVLVTDNPIDNLPVVRKWAQPIRYKLYGTCGDNNYDKTIASNTAGLFKLISIYTGVSISEAETGKDANFQILMGKADKFKDILSKDARNYFSSRSSPFEKRSGYYRWSQDSFTDMVQLIDVNNLGKYPVIWNQVKAQIMNGLGFFGSTGKYSESLFYTGVNNWVPQNGIQEFDQHVIKTLYQPAVKSGMTEQELDAVITNINL